MSENDYIEQSRTTAIRGWVLGNMARGAGWAALVFFGIIFFILLLRALSWALPVNPDAMLAPAKAIITAFV